MIAELWARIVGPKYKLVKRGESYAVKRRDGRYSDLGERPGKYWWKSHNLFFDQSFATEAKARARFEALINPAVKPATEEVVLDWWPK